MGSNLSLDQLEKLADLEFYSNDFSRDITIRDYLKELLATLWVEADDFSGKRPFGNSGWQYDVYIVLVREGYVTGKISEYNELDEVDIKKADNIIIDIIVEIM